MLCVDYREMAACTEVLKREFPSIDGELLTYVEDVLQNGADQFEDGEEVYEAIGEILHEVAQDKSEEDIKQICEIFLDLLKPRSGDSGGGGGRTKILGAPINLKEVAASQDAVQENIQSIWVVSRDDSLKVSE